MPERFTSIRVGFEERAVLRSGMDPGPLPGALAWQNRDLARVVRMTVTNAPLGEYVVRREWEYLPECRCGFGSIESCDRHKILTWAEHEAARALYDSPIEVGREGIGGFAAGQAEETILALRIAGFPVDPAAVRADDGA